MVLCKKCGNQNQLGRVFCTKCGTKLELTHMSSDFVQEVQSHWYDVILRHWTKLVGILVVVVLGMAVAAFWPETQPIGKKGTRVEGRKVEAAINGMRAQGSRTYALTEQEINGYFENFKARSMNVDSVSVVLKEGHFFVRVISSIGNYKVMSYQFQPKMSYDIVLQPTGGKVPRIARVTMGKLKLFGPLRSKILFRFVTMLSSQQSEWAALGNVTEVKSLDGKLSVTGGKK